MAKQQLAFDHHRGKPASTCSRCGGGDTQQRWWGTSILSGQNMGAIDLCAGCLDAFRTFVANGKHKHKPKQPDPPTNVNPPARTTVADEVPIRRAGNLHRMVKDALAR